jgi:glycosyltransferase involved in cell wall biosynthesis
VNLFFLNRCYWPDVEATGQLLTELCSDLAASHRVTVVPGRPNFVEAGAGSWFERERHEGVEIIRVGNRRFTKKSFLGRAVGLLSYLLLAAWAALRARRPDVIVVETDPPLLGALGAFLKAWHRCSLVFYLQDLFPEVGLATGKLKPGLLTALLHRATQLGLRRADRVVVLGEDMRRRVLARGIEAKKVVVIPNWIDTRLVRPAADTLRQAWELNGEFAVMYSGNLGLSQGLEHVLEAARCMRTEPVVFLFVGEGAAKEGLMARAAEWRLPNVRFLPYQPREQLSASLGTADLHLVPLQRGLTGCIVPSKLYGILAAARPYVAAVEEDSEVARVTRANATGLLIEPDDPERLVAAVRWALANRGELAAMGARGRRLAEDQFDRRQAVARFEAVLRQATAGRASRRAAP